MIVSPSAMRLTRYVSPTGTVLGSGGGAWGVVTSLQEVQPKSVKGVIVAIKNSFRFMQLLFERSHSSLNKS